MKKPNLAQFPAEPGVYLYKDSSGRILYVGKAKRLRHRIASYFRDPASLCAKTRVMLAQAESIDILHTATDKEALLLEASLIKKHRPRYNIVLRDDKEYLLFRIATDHPFPRVEVVRRNRFRKEKRQRALFFGPFSSGLAARETWRLIHRHFPLRRCRDTAFTNRTRPCLYHDMGQCLAPCVLPVPQEEYQAVLNKVVLLLSGKSRELVRAIGEEMRTAAEALRFEDAARLRDQVRAVEKTLERQSVVLAEGRNLDLVGVAQVPEGLALGVVFVRDGLLLDSRAFFWPGLAVEDTPELLDGFLAQFYLDRRGLGESIPPRIVVPWVPGLPSDTAQENADQVCADSGEATDESARVSFRALEAALAEIREGPVHIRPPRSADEDRLLLLAAANGKEAYKHTARKSMADLLAVRLRAARPIRRIEAVDISHTGGRQTRAGAVVFQDEEPDKKAYRVYALDEDLSGAGAEAGDDYAALAAWAKRRAASERAFPDLVLIDGGRGQLAAVHRAFSAAGIHTGTGESDAFALAAIAKARDEQGKADRRAGNVADRIFLPGRSNPVAFAPGSPELLFLQRIRDAAHDFVIGRHRRARAAATLSGELTRIPGVGPALAGRLLERFGSLAAMAEAGAGDLAAVPGIGRARAEAIAERLAILFSANPPEK